MKFLHTSDWHVGRTIRNRSRMDEHRAVFADIVDIAKREQVDAVLVTGDIFHEKRPPLAAEELVAQTLAQLARENIVSVVIPGNHDDAARLRTLKPLGDLLQAYMVTDLSADPSELIVTVPQRTGGERALVGCLPYLHPHQVLTAAEGADRSESERLSAYQSMVQSYLEELEKEALRMDSNAVSIVLAHAHISGTEFGGGEWRSSVFPVDPGILPSKVHYVALGHMHQPQKVSGTAAQTHYAGSILQMDFGERGQQKSVCLIEAHPGKPAEVSLVELTTGKALLRRTGTAPEILSQADEFTNAWVEVVLKPEGQTSELIERIRALPGVVSVRFEDAQTGETDSQTIHNPSERPAAELFTDYYKSRRQAEPEPQLVALFERLYREVGTARDESV